MWHEARRQERKIRCLMVDYQRRADRRRMHYEKIKQDPAQFLRVYGRPLKIHWEQSVALAAEGPQSMQPWQGNADIMIDRFDVRAHLDHIPETVDKEVELTEDEVETERKINYEAYRIIVQNEVVGISEDQHLHQIYVDEQFGAIDEKKKAEEEKKKVLAEKKVAIGFTYDDDGPQAPAPKKEDKKGEESEEEDSDLEDVDLDNVLDIDQLTTEQTAVLNQASVEYGMEGDDYETFLQLDREEAEAIRMAKLLEEEKAQFSGRKSRRERRAFKEKRLLGRPISPPSYAARDSPKYEPFRHSSSSRSPSPARGAASLQFITSFGGSDDEGVLHGPALPPHLLPKAQAPSAPATTATPKGPLAPSVSNAKVSRFRDRAREKSPSPTFHPSSGNRRSRSSRSRSRSSSRSHRNRRSRSRSREHHRRSYSPRRSRSRSRSRGQRWSGSRFSDYRNRRRSRSRSRSRRSRSRSRRSLSRSKGWRRKSYSRSRSRSRSRTRRSRSKEKNRSRSRSRSPAKTSLTKSRSRSPAPQRQPSPPPIKRYRRPSLSSHSSEEDSGEEEEDNKSDRASTDSKSNSRTGAQKGVLGNKLGSSSKSKLTPQERLKHRMQVALTKQQKADAKARLQKAGKAELERMNREDELRARAIDMRRREREKRHKERQETEVLDKWTEKEGGHSRSRSRSGSRHRSSRSSSSSHRDSRKKRSRSRSRSGSPSKKSGDSSEVKLVDY